MFWGPVCCGKVKVSLLLHAIECATIQPPNTKCLSGRPWISLFEVLHFQAMEWSPQTGHSPTRSTSGRDIAAAVSAVTRNSDVFVLNHVSIPLRSYKTSTDFWSKTLTHWKSRCCSRIQTRIQIFKSVHVFQETLSTAEHLNSAHRVFPSSMSGHNSGTGVLCGRWGPYPSWSCSRVWSVWWGLSSGHVNRKVRVQREGLSPWVVYQIANEAEQSCET